MWCMVIFDYFQSAMNEYMDLEYFSIGYVRNPNCTEMSINNNEAVLIISLEQKQEIVEEITIHKIQKWKTLLHMHLTTINKL